MVELAGITSISVEVLAKIAGIFVLIGRGDGHALVSLFGVLFRRRISCEHLAPSRQWGLGKRLPEPLRITTGCWLVLRFGQCAVGPLRACRSLPALLSDLQRRSPRHPMLWDLASWRSP